MTGFLDIADFSTDSLKALIKTGLAMKADPTPWRQQLAGKSIALIFEKPSTRTRVSFEVGVTQLGATPLVLDSQSMQLGRGETIADTAKVLSRYVDAIMIRAHTHEAVQELAATASIPVINGLTDFSHPCQVMADVMTLAELKVPNCKSGDLDFSALKVLWAGEGNNVCHSWIEASARFGFALNIATPKLLRPDAATIARAEKEGAHITLSENINAAADGVDLVVTDTWFSMGTTPDPAHQSQLAPFRVTESVMSLAHKDALFMHCLPVYRGNEADAAVVDGAQSVIWHEAENRLHVQKAILCYCLS